MGFRRIRLFVFLVLLSGLAVPAILADDAISLTVDATKTQQKLLQVRLVMPVKPGPLTLYYPKWIPGEHGPTGPIANLVGLKLQAGGKTIPWKRDSDNMYAFHLDVPAGTSTTSSGMSSSPFAEASQRRGCEAGGP